FRIGRVDGDDASNLRFFTHLVPLRDGVPLDHDGEPGSNTEEEDDEIDPLTVVRDAGSTFTCGGEPANNVRLCATPLGFDGRIAARLDAIDGFDRDYYAFALDAMARVEIVADGAVRLGAVLLDVNGRTLATRDAVGEGFTLDAVLAPGLYYLRVDGADRGVDGGDYRLALRQSAGAM
ncbi:MAG: PPC domain-containing protein, partial [Acidobacteriota bacterium]